jgi:hypothetical protein
MRIHETKTELSGSGSPIRSHAHPLGGFAIVFANPYALRGLG